MVNIQKILKDHEKRLSALEILLKKPESQRIAKSRKGLPDYILELRDKGFFSQPKISKEVHQKLQGTYHCELDRIRVALFRLVDRKQLRKASKLISGEKYIAFVW